MAQNKAEKMIMLATPVTICMLIVVWLVLSVDHPSKPWLTRRKNPLSFGKKIFHNTFLYVFVALGGVVIISVLFLLLYKYKCNKILHGWLMLVFPTTTVWFCIYCLPDILRAYNVAMDYVIVATAIWNFVVVGTICIHWKGPLLLQQAYHVVSSVMIAVILLKVLPNWTVWLVLGVFALYDIFAVLAPCGPLRLILKMAEERNENLPTSMVYSTVTSQPNDDENIDGNRDNESNHDNQDRNASPLSTGSFDSLHHLQDITTVTRSNTNHQRQDVLEYSSRCNHGDNSHIERSRSVESLDMSEQHHEAALLLNESCPSANNMQQHPPQQHKVSFTTHQDEESGPKLGLGDFIFYSVLVGKVSASKDWNTTIACFFSILIGLCLTLLLLSMYRKALPALPISIAFGLLFNFATMYLVKPFTDTLAGDQTFI